VLRINEIESAFVYACVLKDVKVSGEEGEWDRTGDIDASVLIFTFYEKGDGNEAARCGFGEVAGPLIHADGADNLFGLRDLVHLRESGTTRQGCGTEDRAEKESSHGLLTSLDAICGAKSYCGV
jgi:hypothetical protein